MERFGIIGGLFWGEKRCFLGSLVVKFGGKFIFLNLWLFVSLFQHVVSIISCAFRVKGGCIWEPLCKSLGGKIWDARKGLFLGDGIWDRPATGGEIWDVAGCFLFLTFCC